MKFRVKGTNTTKAVYHIQIPFKQLHLGPNSPDYILLDVFGASSVREASKPRRLTKVTTLHCLLSSQALHVLILRILKGIAKSREALA